MDRVALMLETVRSGFARTAWSTGLERPAPEVEAAMRKVPRERFVPEDVRSLAYDDRAVPIGYGATISQPYIVALMTTLADVGPGDRVLEVGTGSGYAAAILGELGAEVFTMEIVPELRVRSARLLAELGYTNVQVLEGDGSRGLARHAPFDAILVTACAAAVPEALTDELARGGRLVLPLRADDIEQQLVLVEKDAEGRLHRRPILPVSFVPMLGRDPGSHFPSHFPRAN